ncbi:hypothetical protein, partial [Flavobacterium sp.]|uniref:hypothetical protein n=1 Tax=Flavobacterium sp. TaxID=239 RepID=UPI0037BE2102
RLLFQQICIFYSFWTYLISVKIEKKEIREFLLLKFLYGHEQDARASGGKLALCSGVNPLSGVHQVNF